MQDRDLSPDSDLPPIQPSFYAEREAPASRVEPASRPSAGPIRNNSVGSSIITWTLFVVLLLTGFQFLAPYFAERIQYSLTRGQERAEYEAATEMFREVSLDQLSYASQMISKRVGPSVVHINTTTNQQPLPLAIAPHAHPESQRAIKGQGSGIIVDQQGYIVTNQHVIDGARQIDVRLSDGRRVQGKPVGVDPLTDIAVLKIEADDLIAAQWGDSEELDVGALVWAMGSPFGLQRSITFGILSAKNRGEAAGRPHQDFLQTDAAVNPGNSGGPLVNARGEIVGINTAIVGEAYQGISFSIPSNVAKKVFLALRDGKQVSRGWLGVVLDEVSAEEAQRNGLDQPRGALVLQLVLEGGAESPAASAGIQAGDIVVRWNGAEIGTPGALTKTVADTIIGSAADVVVVRDGVELNMTVIVGHRPGQFN
jgi:S1-C subfamily serine protease